MNIREIAEELDCTEEEIVEWEQKMHKEAVDSYDRAGKDEYDMRNCYKCGQLLRYDSISYHEGYHIDSCY